MLEDFKKVNIKFETNCVGIDYSESVKEVEELILKMNQVFDDKQKSFVNMCVYTTKLYELFSDYNKTFCGKLYDRNKSYSYDDIMKSFGVDNTYSCKLRSCFEKYIINIGDEYNILEMCSGFSPTKLIELLPVPINQIIIDIENKVLSSEMNCSFIRKYVNNWKTLQKQNSKLYDKKEDEAVDPEDEYNPDEIEQAYNPCQHYEFSYFEKKNKAQLLNIVMELQKEYEKLRGEKTSKKTTKKKNNG